MSSVPYFDLQVNGFAGIDFQQPGLSEELLDRALRGLITHRTGRILFTLITDKIDYLCRRLEHVERLRAQSELARQVIVGYHLEGPWLRPEAGYHGAHDPALMTAPSANDFRRLWEASGGRLKLITLAPEWPGSAEVIAMASALGVRTAIGHSNANDEEIDAAIDAGLTLCTHLGNGIPSLLHRHDNIVQRLLSRDELTAVFIPDGIHLPPGVLRNFARAKPEGKVIFTTDCMAAAGGGTGRFTLGRVTVEVAADGVVREPGKDHFAGSSLTMDRAAENIGSFLGWPKEVSDAACSVRVAQALGLA